MWSGEFGLTPLEGNREKKKFTDADVCKYYICGFCPFEEFLRTKHDVGPCPNVHDDSCKVGFISCCRAPCIVTLMPHACLPADVEAQILNVDGPSESSPGFRTDASCCGFKPSSIFFEYPLFWQGSGGTTPHVWLTLPRPLHC